ncbi:hypothetical protein [Streptomyces yerevanensis]|uniref:hypothetical protein n=1 Tax=Streptomyces yerevanensis TaxID=66378 RepID=UPI000524D211|nr:hypothetical protein [Streptomyces yerevanensis]
MSDTYVSMRAAKINMAIAVVLLLVIVAVVVLRAVGGSDMTWNYDKAFDQRDNGTTVLSDVMATAADDIWAAGQSTPNTRKAGDESADHGFLLHHDGTGWQRRPMPASFGTSVYDARFDAVDSGGLLLTASLDLNSLRMAHWDGIRWTALPKLPGDPRAADIKALAPDDIWVLDGGTRAYHWDGTRWTAMDLPTTVTALDGVASDDLWAVGDRYGKEDAGPGLPGGQPAAVHWDGRAWKLVPTPEYHYKVPAPEQTALLTEVVALDGDVHAYGELTSVSEDDEPDPPTEHIHLRWNGTRWTKLPNTEGACADRTQAVRDGDRGEILSARKYLTADGSCERITDPKPPSGYGIKGRAWFRLNAITAVPGTDKILGVGSVASASSDPAYKVIIVSLKR